MLPDLVAVGVECYKKPGFDSNVATENFVFQIFNVSQTFCIKLFHNLYQCFLAKTTPTSGNY